MHFTCWMPKVTWKNAHYWGFEHIQALVMIRFICVKTHTSNLKHLLTILKKFHPVWIDPKTKMYWVCIHYKSNIFFELKLTQFLICQQSNWVRGTNIKWDEIFSVYRSQHSCRSVSLHWPVMKSWDGDWSPSQLFMNRFRPAAIVSADIFCLFVWGLSSHSRIFNSFGDITITSEGLQIWT